MPWLSLLLVSLLAGPPVQAPAGSTWQSQVHARVTARDFEGALVVVRRQLEGAPADEDAHFWQARLSAWLGRWADAERGYLALIDRAPRNADYLLGLAGVRLAQQQPLDALDLIDRAQALDEARADLFVTRGRALRALGRTSEAQAAFARALALAPADADARAGLRSVRPAPRHRLTSGADVDRTNFSGASRAFTHDLRTAWTATWASNAGIRIDQRAGQTAWRVLGAAAWRSGPRTTLTAGASAGDGRVIVSRAEFFADVGVGLRLARDAFIRGVEITSEVRWLWFDGARVFTARPTVALYLPRDWRATFAVTAARSAFTGLGAEWSPSTSARLNFPIHGLLDGHVFYATGTENFARRDQIGRFAAKTFGGGVRLSLRGGQDVSIALSRQYREQGRVQTSVGIWHGVRF